MTHCTSLDTAFICKRSAGRCKSSRVRKTWKLRWLARPCPWQPSAFSLRSRCLTPQFFDTSPRLNGPLKHHLRADCRSCSFEILEYTFVNIRNTYICTSWCQHSLPVPKTSEKRSQDAMSDTQVDPSLLAALDSSYVLYLTDVPEECTLNTLASRISANYCAFASLSEQSSTYDIMCNAYTHYFSAILVFDYLLTFPGEVDFIWSRKVSVPTFIFISNRYVNILAKIFLLANILYWPGQSTQVRRPFLILIHVLTQLLC